MYPFLYRLCAAFFLLAAASAKAQTPVLKITGPETGSVYLQKPDIDVRATVSCGSQDQLLSLLKYIHTTVRRSSNGN